MVETAREPKQNAFPFHITVVAYPSSGLNLANEIRLLKAALLYADKVRLCGLASSMLVLICQWSTLSEDQQLDLIAELAPVLNQPNLITVIEQYKALKRRGWRRRSKHDLLAYARIRDALRKGWNGVRDGIEKMAYDAGIEGLISALSSGLVELQLFSSVDKETMASEFLSTVLDAVTSHQTYPLFDRQVGELYDAAMQAGIVKPQVVHLDRAKQVGLSTSLLSRLPLFDAANVDEIVGIRGELDKPLGRFRAAIIEFSKDIENEPWGADFDLDVEQVYRVHVVPAMEEIEHTIKSNSLIQAIASKYLTESLPTSSILGIALSSATQLDPLLSGLITQSYGIASAAYKIAKERRVQREEIERRDLYFYYRVRERLAEQ